MNIEIIGVAYTPSKDNVQETPERQNRTQAQSHVDQAADVVAQNTKAREQARQEADFAAFAETVDAHDLNMTRVMELLNDPALAEL
jgi:hypothetical protein